MERRKILLGSGAAIATVLAGCSSDETGDDSNSNDDDSDDSLNGDDNGENDGSDDKAEIPGLDRDKLKIDSGKLTIEDVNKDGKTVDVVATTTTSDPETLFAELDSLGDDMSAAITDPEAFAAAVDSVTWILEKDGAKVMSFYVDVKWAIKYMNDEMSQDAFVERVLETTDETQ
ncbi:hypothetical protein [Natrinema sp. 1APR25-10V2]|uniref:hypothetical protein n=1 Tax=Natrinema sp. 1APR25-10V2 TaxID=2951081 RepID=UPI002876BF39|nr:hypothetical protein [Natrinema sp. 1APR25-10V2]MDS0475374.1 hypothetical protein [Natrinema sp. 1APR25-10V2]